jgi:cytochrome c biogenesis protein CcmG/thiol:disulfide interchange protein DsbE
LLRTLLVMMLTALFCVLYSSLHETVVGRGDYAPDFTITADTGELVSSRDFGGRALLLNFWATWCAPCRDEMPSLQSLAKRLGPEGLVVLAVSQDKDGARYSRFVRQMQAGFLTLRQPDQTIQRSYGTSQIPESYLIDRNGKVQAKFISDQDWTSPTIVERIRSLLAEGSAN